MKLKIFSSLFRFSNFILSNLSKNKQLRTISLIFRYKKMGQNLKTVLSQNKKANDEKKVPHVNYFQG